MMYRKEHATPPDVRSRAKNVPTLTFELVMESRFDVLVKNTNFLRTLIWLSKTQMFPDPSHAVLSIQAYSRNRQNSGHPQYLFERLCSG